MMILNEENYAKNILLGKNKDIKSVVKIIGYIVRYNYYILNKGNKTNYADTVKWLTATQPNFDEEYYSNVISTAIKHAPKRPFYYIDNIQITQSELELIRTLDNLRAEKILFVLLCMAKQQSISKGFTDGLVQYTMTDLCKMARISVPAEDREYILHGILTKGLISCPKKNDTKCLKVNFINDDETELTLKEIDCQELAYVYLNWKNKKGFKTCPRCGRLFKLRKDQTMCQYCNEELAYNQKSIYCMDCGKSVALLHSDTRTCRCSDCDKKAHNELVKVSYEPVGDKTVICMGCGKEFKVSAKNNHTTRCKECYKKERNQYMKELMRKKREN